LKDRNREWIVHLFESAASHFAERALGEDSNLVPITEWEVSYLRIGQEAGLLGVNGSFLEVSGRKPYSLFGLNREWLIHIAEYIRLIVEEGFDEKSVQFEYKLLDIVVFSEDSPEIGIEVKKSEKAGNKLRQDLLKLLPNPEIPENTRGNDALNKIKCLLDLKPPEFRIVTPTRVWKYDVNYGEGGKLSFSEIL
jgi:hypothetical protein